MKKFLFVLLLLPALTALGHDIYFYTENQDKGFRLSDLGKLWDTYHKESHDQWKIKVDEISDTVSDMVGNNEQPPLQKQENTTTFQAGFSQEDGKTGTIERPAPQPEPIIKENASAAKKSIGFLLEQKAVFVFASIPAIAFILNLILSLLFRPRKSKENSSFKGSKKKFTYGRK